MIQVASQGLGKAMIAKNVAHHAMLQGVQVLCVTSTDLLLDLGGQETSRMQERRLRQDVEPGLLCIKAVDYLAYDNRVSDLLFQVVSRRYERRSIPLTTNLASKDCNTVFPNVTCATALIDRLIHHVETISTMGKSYRRHEQVQFPTRLCRHARHVRRLITPASLRCVFAWSCAPRLGTYRALHGG